MKECCYSLKNLETYGATKKKVVRHPNLLVLTYAAYMRCKVCETLLRSEIVKNIHTAPEPRKRKPRA